MVGSLKNNISMSWKDHFKIFLKFYESYFEDFSLKQLDAERKFMGTSLGELLSKFA